MARNQALRKADARRNAMFVLPMTLFAVVLVALPLIYVLGTSLVLCLALAYTTHFPWFMCKRMMNDMFSLSVTLGAMCQAIFTYVLFFRSWNSVTK